MAETATGVAGYFDDKGIFRVGDAPDGTDPRRVIYCTDPLSLRGKLPEFNVPDGQDPTDFYTRVIEAVKLIDAKATFAAVARDTASVTLLEYQKRDDLDFSKANVTRFDFTHDNEKWPRYDSILVVAREKDKNAPWVVDEVYSKLLRDTVEAQETGFDYEQSILLENIGFNIGWVDDNKISLARKNKKKYEQKYYGRSIYLKS